MPETELDLVVLGGGTGGYVAAIRASQLGLRVAVVEKDKLGGTCLHRGCIPSKALLRSAELMAQMKESADFGIEVTGLEFQLTTAMARKEKVVAQLHRGVEFLMKKHEIRVIRGIGRVMGPSIFSPQSGAVSVEYSDGETEILSPRFTLIATGSKPNTLPGLTLDGVRVVSSDDALEWAELPSSLAIIGGGAIGIEWASMLSDFGVDVTVLEFMPRILPLEDEEISREVHRALSSRGVHVVTGAKVLPEQMRTSEVVTLAYEQNGQTVELSVDKVLVAVGRTPVVENIGIEATEIKLERGAIQVDTDYRTAEENIFAIGDVIGGIQLAHVAAHEGIHAVEVMSGRSPRPLLSEHIPRCTYSRPEVASIGWTEAEATKRGHRVKVGKFPFQAIGKALVHGDGSGFAKVVADAETEDILGVHLVGPHATDLISEASLAMVLNATPWEIAHTIHPHPTLAEVLGEAALAVDGRAIHA
ncbi:MAG: dihydrolipoyl dehydrogenase [Alicyclobacillaceae bacterium]|jgi:dihydrolipoamide dehydrogenase|uniref:dihydrolipoyl dehydrogenase n=1 Tax=Alicyclobacillus sp. SP_1 TaxID=2942475 RepID=UPI00215705F1|nr:dihydrolipoyl dehydrogenase [Alicyclobacillus sp. SP_1]MCY0888982.1 dihydrolipoyl dehydrogenase [Alicyclobacillaceae bacterium]